jgi:hypothetical protein
MKAVCFVLGASFVLGMFGGCANDAAKNAGSGASAGTPKSGSRIKITKPEVDGATWSGVYDSELEAACYFQRTSDGETRCVPLGDGRPYANLVFTDSDCTEVVAYTTTDCDPAAYSLLSPPYEACTEFEGYTVYEVGDTTDAPTETYYQSTEGCVAQTLPVEYTFYEVQEASLDDFAIAEREIIPVTDKLGVAVLRTEDGASIPQELYDLERETGCYPQTVGSYQDDQNYCLGNLAYTDDFNYGFSDADCTESAAGAVSCTEKPDAIMKFGIEDGCSVTELLEVGDKVSGPVYRDQGECIEEESPVYEAYYEPGDELSPEIFAKVERSHAGSGRIVAEMWVSEGKTVGPTGNLWDTEFDTVCYPQEADDGSTYCIPNNIAYTYDMATNFADDACTEFMVSQLRDECSSNVQPYEYGMLTITNTESCFSSLGDAKLFELEKLDTDVTYSLQGEDCIEVPVAENTDYFSYAKEIDPADVFAEITKKTDD